MKHKITLEEGARQIKECYRRVPPALYDKVWKHLQEMIDVDYKDIQQPLGQCDCVSQENEWQSSILY